jgi:hypothetical protein
MIIIITSETDNYKSDAFNRFMQNAPSPLKIVFAKEPLDTTLNKVIGAISGCDNED